MIKKVLGYCDDRPYHSDITVPNLVKHCFILVFSFILLFTLVSTTQAASHSDLVKPRFTSTSSLIGLKKYYLALGDSGAFGFQPNLDFDHGYVDDFFKYLKGHGIKDLANLGCYGETSFTFINFGCPFPFLRKQAYVGPQLTAALNYLHQYPGQVSPVTLDIGINDFILDLNPLTCSVSSNFQNDLIALDTNLTQTILPQLNTGLRVNGQVTGDLILMNYFDPFQNECPNTVPYFQILNQHLSDDVRGFGIIVDVFTPFGGSEIPNNNICSYTWMCSIFHDYHPTNEGYSVIATIFKKMYGY